MRSAVPWIAALVLCGSFPVRALAQNESIPTLHVYTDLVQIPTLVLDEDQRPLPPIAANRFFVSLDGGPKFRVTHVRLEGEDPISLAVLLDTDQPFPDLVGKIDEAAAGLAPQYLHPRDRVSMYALDCGLVQSSIEGPPNPTMLKQAVDAVLEQWQDHRHGHDKACVRPWHLWDSLAVIATKLSKEPGRRVVLVVSDGEDHGSKNNWNDVTDFAQEHGIAIFGLTQTTYVPASRRYSDPDAENIFSSVCQLTGGTVLSSDTRGLGKELAAFVQMLRGRYIVEFPRPRSTVGGHHGMLITIERSSALIRPSGVSVPVDDPEILSDPTTIPTDPASAPQLGKRKVSGPY